MPVDLQFLKYSDQFVWYQHPCHIQRYVTFFHILMLGLNFSRHNQHNLLNFNFSKLMMHDDRWCLMMMTVDAYRHCSESSWRMSAVYWNWDRKGVHPCLSKYFLNGNAVLLRNLKKTFTGHVVVVRWGTGKKGVLFSSVFCMCAGQKAELLNEKTYFCSWL